MVLMRSVADARPPQRFQCHRSPWAGTGQVGHLQPGGSSAVSERPPITTTWRVILWLTWVLSGRDMRGSGKKRASLRRVWTRRDAHTRPLCWQPIPHCNDNSCPSVRPPSPVCGHKPAHRGFNEACWCSCVSNHTFKTVTNRLLAPLDEPADDPEKCLFWFKFQASSNDRPLHNFHWHWFAFLHQYLDILG